jgi:hypothetical protein
VLERDLLIAKRDLKILQELWLVEQLLERDLGFIEQ